MLENTWQKYGAIALVVMSGMSTYAVAEDHFNRVGYNTQLSRQVANDQMQAVLSISVNDKNAANLATQINAVLDQAITVAKAYPQIKVSSGNYMTEPVYNDKQKLTHWRGQAQLILTGQNFNKMGELIARLQDKMVLESIDFSVSEAERIKIENALYSEVSKQFQQRAEILKSAWQAKAYKLVNLNINISNYDDRPRVAMAKYAQAEALSASVPVEAGNSTITISANGSIELQP